MAEMDEFKILEKMKATQNLRDIPVTIINIMDLTIEQKNQLSKLGQQLLLIGTFNEKDLLTSIQHALEQVQTKNG